MIFYVELKVIYLKASYLGKLHRFIQVWLHGSPCSMFQWCYCVCLAVYSGFFWVLTLHSIAWSSPPYLPFCLQTFRMVSVFHPVRVHFRRHLWKYILKYFNSEPKEVQARKHCSLSYHNKYLSFTVCSVADRC